MLWIILGILAGLVVGIVALLFIVEQRQAKKQPKKIDTSRERGIVKILNTERGRIGFVSDESQRMEAFLLTQDTRMVNFPGSTEQWEEKIKAIALGQHIEIVYATDHETALEVQLLNAR